MDDTAINDDLSALAWVHGELRRSLEAANKALRRHLKEAEATSGSDIDAVDPAVLRTARTQLHQGVGALELIGLPAVADVLRASEAAVQRMVTRPAMVDAAAVETIEKLSFALLDFLGRQLAGKPVSPVMLFPQYRAALQLAAADRIHPADLWRVDWHWHELPHDTSASPRNADDEARTAMETLVLALMRLTPHDDGRGPLSHMSDLCADLAAGTRMSSLGGAEAATLWQLAAGVFEAEAGGLLTSDVYAKRIASRLLAQLRMRARGQVEPSQRLAQDLLFFCSHAKAPDAEHPSPRLAAVRRAWKLDALPTADYETPRLGRFDPAVMALARKRVAAARDSWSAVAGGELHRMGGLSEQFSLVGDSLRRLFPGGEALAQSLQTAVSQTTASNSAPPAALAMEVATAILYLDASLEDGEFDHPALPERVQGLATRIDDVRIGAAPQPLDGWMEELYRRVSDRQTMGSVVQELRASLSEIEKQIDQYFRDPTQRQLLIPVPAQLSAMRGVLSVLGLDQASAAALHMRDDVDALAQTEVDPHRAVQAGTFDRLADNLGALSFLIDMISVQPALAKSLFRFDPATGSLSAVMGQSERVSAFAAFDDAAPAAPAAPRQVPAVSWFDQLRALGHDAARPEITDEAIARRLEPLAQQALVADQGELARLLSSAQTTLRLSADATERRAMRAQLADAVAALGPPPAPEVPPSAPIPDAKPVAAGDTGLEDDAEMREIFIEEAREVVSDAQAALERLADAPDSANDMTAVRRAFHTLKGSSRMVGLRGFGDAAWACEQLYNARLASAARMDNPLRLFTAEALVYLADWAEAIAANESKGHSATAVSRAADALRLDGLRLPIAAPGAPDDAAPAAAPPALPVLTDLALPPLAEAAVSGEPAPPVAAPPAAVPIDVLEFDFDLDEEPLPEPTVAELLVLRVPDLPSAADLELGAPAPEAEAALPTLEDALSFDLDLGALDAPEPLPATLAKPAPTPEPAAASPLDLLLDDLPTAATAPEMAAAEAVAFDFADLDLDFTLPPPLLTAPAVHALADLPLEPAPEPALPVAAEPAAEPVAEQPEEPAPAEEEQVKVIGPLRIGIPLFNIYLNEADELSRRLCTELAEWSLEDQRHAVPESSVVLAHSLAGSSATVGYLDLSALARELEHALMRSHAQGHGRLGEAALFNEAADEVRRLLHQFAAGFLRPVAPELMQRLAEHERLPLQAAAADEHAAADAVSGIDIELFPIFEEEADELLPQVQMRLRDWLHKPIEAEAAMACMRSLHTLKGGARLAGAMHLGELAHGLETAIEALSGRGNVQPADVEPLLARADAMSGAFESLRRAVAAAAKAPAAPAPAAAAAVPAAIAAITAIAAPRIQAPPVATPQPAVAEAPVVRRAPPVAVPVAPPVEFDWSRFTAGEALPSAAAERPAAGGAVVRVRASLLDRLVNQTGEVSITRARIDADVKLLQGSLGELTDSLDRMRRQLRDIEVQAETQISTRIEAAKAAAETFDPLEMDRFTRFQELTRFMAESVNDVATLQRSLQRTLQSTEDELAAQARLTRELQDDLLRTRMVEFESLSDRLYRTARQAAKETGKQVKLEILGGAIEIDRSVLERMTGPFEHLLRNSVAHGIELPELRTQAGKDASGTITITVAQSGNEVAVEFADDGGGLDLKRIRARGVERGLLPANIRPTDAELAQLIFTPGFSTAEAVTELAGRGVGLDVVRAELNAMGGRVETATDAGRGTRFKLLLPLTTAVTQVVMLRCGELQVAVPSTLIELVRRAPNAEVQAGYADGRFAYAGEQIPFFWLAALLRAGQRGEIEGRTQTVVIIRSASQRVAVHVDEVVGNQEVVVKNVGPQLSRLPGLAGVTLLPSGAVALIYNPVALASLYADEARALMRVGDRSAGPHATEPAAPRAAMVMVVDDSLTVRRVTQRLLVREGYRVVTAKDGLEALERLAEERPVVLLSDIEMPRMDGFDLVRNVRADPKLQGLPVVMITSRIAQKHRDYAAELGVDHYLGKPYSEDELLALVARYAGADIPA